MTFSTSILIQTTINATLDTIVTSATVNEEARETTATVVAAVVDSTVQLKVGVVPLQTHEATAAGAQALAHTAEQSNVTQTLLAHVRPLSH